MTGKQIIEKSLGIKLPDNYTSNVHTMDTLINKRQMIEIIVGLCYLIDTKVDQKISIK